MNIPSVTTFCGQITHLFSDIDDTLTTDGKLTPEAYQALWDLHLANVQVIAVTGRPAGWCELIARQWPVRGVVGENGGLYFSYHEKAMKRYYALSESERKVSRNQLEQIQTEILSKVPGASLASDQFCRESDLAIDFCEDVPPLSSEKVRQIVDIFHRRGAIAKVSSIHVNGWFGNYDKLTMCSQFCTRELGFSLSDHLNQMAYVGDSPNDEPMFKYFRHSFAVKNINKFLPEMKAFPTYISEFSGGQGFAQVAKHILKNNSTFQK